MGTAITNLMRHNNDMVLIRPFDDLFVCCSTVQFAVLCRFGEQFLLITIPPKNSVTVSLVIPSISPPTPNVSTLQSAQQDPTNQKAESFSTKTLLQHMFCYIPCTRRVPTRKESGKYRGLSRFRKRLRIRSHPFQGDNRPTSLPLVLP